MTTVQTKQAANINQGPRGIGARNTGGAYTQDGYQDIKDSDSLEHGLTLLAGTTDPICPINYTNSIGKIAHDGGNYMITAGAADAITIPTPTAGMDDNLVVDIWSASAFAHTVTAPSAIIQAGEAVKTTITFPAFPGAGVRLRAYNGFWQIIGQGFTANTLS